MDRDQADRPRVTQLAQPLQHPRRLQPEVRIARQRFGQHDFIGFGARVLACWDDPLRLRTTVGRNDPVLAAPWREHAQDAAGRLAHAAQGAAFIAARPHRLEPHQDALAWRKCGRTRPFRHHQDSRRRTRAAFPGDRAGEGIAIAIRAGHLNDRSVGQLGSGAARRGARRRSFLIPRVRFASMLNSFRHCLRDRDLSALHCHNRQRRATTA